MSHNQIKGPMGGPRPFCSCEHLFTVQIEGRDPPTDDQLDQIGSNIGNDSVDVRPARFGGSYDVTINTGDGTTSNNEQDELLRGVRQVLIDSHKIVGWRVESV